MSTKVYNGALCDKKDLAIVLTALRSLATKFLKKRVAKIASTKNVGNFEEWYEGSDAIHAQWKDLETGGCFAITAWAQVWIPVGDYVLMNLSDSFKQSDFPHTQEAVRAESRQYKVYKEFFCTMILKLSEHAKKKHQSEKWNAVTIRDAYYDGQMQNIEFVEGETADYLCGDVEGEIVGLVLGKPVLGVRVVITGFAAPLEYWKSV